MSEPTPPRGSEPEQPAVDRAETHSFAAPMPPQQPPAAAGPAPAAAVPAPAPRRSKLLMGAAAAGLLGVGVVVGVVVGQATAGSAAADPGSSTTQVGPGGSGLDGSQQYGTPPDGGLGGHPGGRGDFGTQVPGGTDGGTPDGTTDGGTTDDGTTGDDSTT
jgi:hypothetical protein